LTTLHEFSLADNVITTCVKTAERYNSKKIVEIFLEIGDFSLVSEELLDQCIRIVAKDTIASEAKLNVKRTPGILTCLDCKQSFDIWFREEKEDSTNYEQSNLQNYENGMHAPSGYQFLGMNLFKCKNCGSKNTNLTGGKDIKIKNIKIEEN
jgi:hydrogenase nickel incorporation protein HypA/HybF